MYANISNLETNVTVQIEALNSSITKNITLQLNELNNLIDKLFNKLQLSLYNEYTGLGISPYTFLIYYDGSLSQNTIYYTLNNYTHILITDYFGNEIFNSTVPVPNTLAIGVPILDLGWINNNSFPIRLNITQNGKTRSWILRENQLTVTQLISGNYSYSVERVWLAKNGTITKTKLLYSQSLNLTESVKLIYLTLEGGKLFPQDFIKTEEEWSINIFGAKITKSQLISAAVLAVITGIIGIMIREAYIDAKKKELEKEGKEVVYL